MKRFTRPIFLIAAILLSVAILTAGCAAAATPQATNEVVTENTTGTSSYAPAPAMKADHGGVVAQSRSLPGAQAPAAAQNGQTDAYNAADAARMIVYTGSVSLQVNDTADTVSKIQDLLKSVNGYIATRSLVAYGKDKFRGTISIRIPAAALEATMAQIKALGVKVLKEDQASNDVTAEYTDLDARRKNLEAYEVELQKLLTTVQERTGKAEDILAVYNQLTEVRGQIEQIQGRQNYLNNTSTLATYTIELVPVEEVVIQGQPGWDPGRTVRSALDRLVTTMQGLGDAAIVFLIYFLPVLLVLIVPVAIFVWVIRMLMKRRTPKKTVAAS